MSDFTVYKPRNGQILKKGRVMSASDLAVELTQLQATNERLTAERDAMKDIVTACRFADETGYVDGYGFVVGYQQMTEEGDKLLAILKLEQQAKGVDDARHLYSINTFEGRRCWSSALYSYAETLRQQAKEKG
jgi:hypothetical protein